jgi:hypothetical protein
MLADGPITYVKDEGFLLSEVAVSSLTLGNETIPMGRENSAILDTGTNVLLLPPNAYSQVQRAMCANASLVSCEALWRNECVDLTEDQLDQYPPLSFQLDGTVLEMDSRDYLLLGSPLAATGKCCLGIRNGWRQHGLHASSETLRIYDAKLLPGLRPSAAPHRLGESEQEHLRLPDAGRDPACVSVS